MLSNCTFYNSHNFFKISERLEQLARDIGTARDGTQLRSEIEQLMKDLYGKIQHFNRECANLSRVASQGDVSEGRERRRGGEGVVEGKKVAEERETNGERGREGGEGVVEGKKGAEVREREMGREGEGGKKVRREGGRREGGKKEKKEGGGRKEGGREEELNLTMYVRLAPTLSMLASTKRHRGA